jgi:hypothetical protein
MARPPGATGPLKALSVSLLSLALICCSAACSGRISRVTVTPTPRAAITAIATPADSPPPSPTPPPAPFFAGHRIVAYYGNPLSPLMGTLGEGDPTQMLARLRQQAAAYAALDPSRQVVPAMELIESVAQDRPTDNGLYLYRCDPALVDQYTQLATQNNMLLILDEQIGRSTPEAEVQRVLPRLASPSVQLALDPEFTMAPGQVPGRDLGSMDAADINRVQAMLEQVAVKAGLPSKILIVHEFQPGMITNLDQLRSYPHVDLVLDADGFGPRQTKLDKYNALIAARPLGRAGVKLFYKYDPDLWTPQDVLGLDPPPDVVIYQ